MDSLIFPGSGFQEGVKYGDIGMGYAVERCDLQMIMILADAGSQLDYDGSRTGIPLVNVAVRGDHNLKIVEYFLDHGVDPNIQSHRDGGSVSGTPMHMAALCAQVRTVELLIDRGADVNMPSSRHKSSPFIIQYALHAEPPAIPERTEILRMLLNAGADINVRTADGDTLANLSQKRFNGDNLLNSAIGKGEETEKKRGLTPF